MKKWFVFLMVVCVMISSASAMASYEDVSDEDLLKMADEINDELISRGLKNTVYLKPGTYRVGTDIPFGLYSLYVVDDDYPCELAMFDAETREFIQSGEIDEDLSDMLVPLDFEVYLRFDKPVKLIRDSVQWE